MKTVNLTLWCNLFSTASKYNIQVKKSHTKPLVIFGSSVFIFLLLLLHFSYAYYLALAIASLTLTVLSILFTQQSTQKITQQFTQQSDKQIRVLYQFELTSQGICTFDDEGYYQLQANSRCSFLGCWLTLMPITTKNTLFFGKYKQLFIFRDSLSEQDFSRLSRVLKGLASNT